MLDGSDFDKSILDTADALKNRCKELEKELNFTKALLDDMSKIAQKNEDLKNIAEYKLGKEIEKNKELQETLHNSIESTTRLFDSIKDYTQTTSDLAKKNAILQTNLLETVNRNEEIVKEALDSRLRNIWNQAALQCLADQIKSDESSDRCLITISIAEDFEKFKPELIRIITSIPNPEDKTPETINNMHCSIMKIFAKEWSILESKMT